MNVFTEFRRGKTIENQGIRGVLYSAGSHLWGNMPPAPPGDIE